MLDQATTRPSPPTLARQTEQAKDAFLSELTTDVRRAVLGAFQRLMSSDAATNAKGVGDEAPDFELPDARGGKFHLKEALKYGPIVLSFYRGGWCPFCNLEFKALHDRLPEMRALGATLVAVSPQDLEHSSRTVTDLGLDFPVLSDQSNRLTREYGLLMTLDVAMRPLYREWGIDLPGANGDESYELPVPATYVIDRYGVIRAVYVDRDYTRRMEPARIVNTLKRLSD